jgi:hypothetical protein
MQTNYASATIAADRSQRSFGLSLDQFLAKRGATTIVARGRSLKQSQGALFASIQSRTGVPPWSGAAPSGRPCPDLTLRRAARTLIMAQLRGCRDGW